MASSSSSSPEMPVTRSTAPNGEPSRSIDARLHDVLEDLSSRFILNLPEAELASLERVCFQVEQAHWYYEDFVREQDPSFPTMTLKKFSHSLFHVCPLLSHWGNEHEQTFQSFMAYKTRVPVCGAIMLNETWDKCLLVKGWKATSAWSFPKGKINEQEPRSRCAAREVLEETGYDLSDQIKPDDVVELSIRDQSLSLYIVPNVPEDFQFETRTRKEISKIAWFRLTDLPTWRRNKSVPGKFYLITPFIGPLKAFLRDRKAKDNNRKSRRRSHAIPESDPHLSSGDDAHLDARDASNIAQESSSQSSADHGDPQTPSPLYSEPLVHTVSGSDESSVQQALNLDAVDPHFARLLTSLSLSASASSMESLPVEKSNGRPPPQTTTQGGISTQPVQVPSSSPSRSSTIVPARTPSTVPAVSPSPSHQRRPSQANPSPSPLRPSAPEAYLRSLVNGIDSPSKPAPMPRRSTADISPYMQRATAAPAIPKQMKYISMLESVAKESERMTPRLERQMLSMVGSTLPVRDQYKAPGPLNSIYGIREESPVIYSSGPGPSTNAAGFVNQPALPSFSSLPSLSSNDPFTVRPHTSSTFHAPYQPSTRPSFNENQLAYMSINGTRHHNGQPAIPPLGPHPAVRMPAPQQLPFMVQQPFPPNRGPVPQPNLRLVPPQQLLSSTDYNEPAPLSAPAVSQGFHLPRANPVNNAHLLSILNTPAVPHSHPGDPSSVPIGSRG